MFNLGPGEIAVIVIAVLLIFGPKKLPELAKSIGASVNEFRKSMANPYAEGGADAKQIENKPWAEQSSNSKTTEMKKGACCEAPFLYAVVSRLRSAGRVGCPVRPVWWRRC